MSDADKDPSILHNREALREYATAGWSAVAATAALVIGAASDSMALTGFGLDAVLRAVFAGLTAWQLQHPPRGQMRTNEYPAHERRALFAIGVLFFLLALYLLDESGSRLYYSQQPSTSITALAVSVVLSLLTCALAIMKFLAARNSETRAVRAGAAMTVYGAYLALMLIIGISVPAAGGWWWADPAAALLMLPGIVRSGWEAVEQSKRRP